MNKENVYNEVVNKHYNFEESIKLAISLTEQKAREEVIEMIEKIKVKHKTLLPDYRIGYDLALKELKQKLQGETK